MCRDTTRSHERRRTEPDSHTPDRPPGNDGKQVRAAAPAPAPAATAPEPAHDREPSGEQVFSTSKDQSSGAAGRPAVQPARIFGFLGPNGAGTPPPAHAGDAHHTDRAPPRWGPAPTCDASRRRYARRLGTSPRAVQPWDEVSPREELVMPAGCTDSARRRPRPRHEAGRGVRADLRVRRRKCKTALPAAAPPRRTWRRRHAHTPPSCFPRRADQRARTKKAGAHVWRG